MDKIKVLFIDDDVALGQLVSTALQEEGFEIHYQSSLLGAKSVVAELEPNVIVLDVEIGLYDGITVAPELQRLVPDAPILFISSHTELSEVVRGLAAGAVTYLKKPIEIEELIAYIKRYAVPFRPSLLKLASFGLDLSTRIVYKDSQQIRKLSKLEFMLLKLLYDHKNKVVTREEIEKLWEGAIMSEHSLYNFIAKLRKLFADDSDITLVTMQENGYMLSLPEKEESQSKHLL